MSQSLVRDTTLLRGPGVAVMRPSTGWRTLQLQELWSFRELLFFLVWRDIKVRYKQTLLGAAWAVLQPLLTMLVFTVFFGRLAKVPSDGVPYGLFAYTALVPWMFFANAVAAGANSLVNNANLLKKVYFPRLVLPLSSVGAGVVDLLIACVVMAGLMLAYGFFPPIQVLLAPLFLVLGIVAAAGVSLWLSAINIQFRDVRYAVPFIVQFWLFATPVAYPSSLIEDPRLRMAFALNPMVGVVEGMRWAVLGTRGIPASALALSVAVALLLLVSGAFYFRRAERRFADVA